MTIFQDCNFRDIWFWSVFGSEKQSTRFGKLLNKTTDTLEQNIRLG